MLRNSAKVAAGLVATFVLVLAGEVVYTLRRDFPLNDPEQPVAGEFGKPGAPELKFVVIGDSSSVGVGTTPEKSYPWLLSSWLGEQFHVTLNVVGFGGATTADVERTQVDAALALEPDLVLVEIGANDTTHLTPIPLVRRNISGALRRLAAGDAEVVVIGPPHMGTSPAFVEPLRSLTGLRGTMVKKAIEEEAEKLDLPFVDLAAGTRRAFENEPEEHYSSDWFHPGAAGYKLWAEVMYPAVLQAARR